MDFLNKFENSKPGFVFLLMVSALILFLRRPDFLMHAQFWAEDGRVWFAEAHNIGIFQPLFWQQDGYYQTFSRIIADLASFVPLKLAPLVMNIFTFIAQLLPVAILLSSRLNNVIPKYKNRLVFALLFLILPNTSEVHISLTYAQWFLALSTFMVVIAREPLTKLGKIFDIILISLSGLSGPYIIFLWPVIFLQFWKRRGLREKIFLLIASAASLLQISALFLSSSQGPVRGLPDFSIRLLMAIINRQIFMGTVLGAKGYLWFLYNLKWSFWFFTITAILSLVILAYSFLKAQRELKLLILFGALVLAASLFNSTAATESPGKSWELLSRSFDGVRYWFIPIVAFMSTLIWGSQNGPKFIQWLSKFFLALMLVGIIMDFSFPPLSDQHLNVYAEQFSQLPKNQSLIIPINPPGWNMKLLK